MGRFLSTSNRGFLYLHPTFQRLSELKLLRRSWESLVDYKVSIEFHIQTFTCVFQNSTNPTLSRKPDWNENFGICTGSRSGETFYDRILHRLVFSRPTPHRVHLPLSSRPIHPTRRSNESTTKSWCESRFSSSSRRGGFKSRRNVWRGM